MSVLRKNSVGKGIFTKNVMAPYVTKVAKTKVYVISPKLKTNSLKFSILNKNEIF